jgi:hypothetical protein
MRQFLSLLSWANARLALYELGGRTFWRNSPREYRLADGGLTCIVTPCEYYLLFVLDSVFDHGTGHGLVTLINVRERCVGFELTRMVS